MDTDTVDMEATLDKVTLDSSQRCDRCGAQARVQVFFGNGMDLLFCNHHRVEYSKKLEQVALTIRESDESLD